MGIDLPFKIKLCGAELRGVRDGRIVFDAALTSRINVARNAVGDSGEDQRLNKTLPRKGYRFVGRGAGRTGAGSRSAPLPLRHHRDRPWVFQTRPNSSFQYKGKPAGYSASD